ncbi:Maf-like protein [Inconstantimicrobium mannanitabidum]|uniref:Maf-like protein n=1 Tax=Inconstantimicrobium mannanitabidum TaxID=1604901 RepID=A0ACB5R7X0_9CLOT|nr:Maf-like protein [Clostridium sp. TW13]GKX65111.1 Maf-like protein [Clostridium sp. TW13]
MNVVLASASIRRQELLERLYKEFTIIVSDFDESSVVYKGIPEEYVKELSKGKAMAVCKNINEPSIIIAADTIVVYNNDVLLKPKDEKDAYEMLKKLSGNLHYVYSGITVVNTYNNKIISESVETQVKFSDLNDAEINEYIKTGEPMDKSGAYGIQGYGGVFVEKINGCYYNVVGLPLNKLKEIIKRIS